MLEIVQPKEPQFLLQPYLRGDEFIDVVTYDMAKVTTDYINSLFELAGYPNLLIKSFYGHNFQGSPMSLENYPALRVYRKSEVLSAFALNYKTTIFVFSFVTMFSRKDSIQNLNTFVNDVIYALLINTLNQSDKLPILCATLDDAGTIDQDVQTTYLTEVSENQVRYFVNIEAKMKNLYGEYK